MSAIGGIHNFVGDVDEEALRRMEPGLSRLGPDAVYRHKSPAIGMVYRPFHTNRESRFETQPFVARTGEIVCWDGRLDNRNQLINDLHHHLTNDRTDAALVVTAYCNWGVDFLSKLIGDFALALWEPQTNTLILARDFVGPRSLYYQMNESRVVWSTDLQTLIDVVGIPLKLDDEYIAGFLTKLPEGGVTPYRHFKSVPPGHSVIIERGRCRVQSFWQPDPSASIRYKSDREYEEHFCDVFRESMRCRLRTDGPAWAELSGGMDSSPIVCVANDLINHGDVQANALATVSRVYDEASKSDERKYIKPVEERIGRCGLHLREDQYRLLAPWSENYVPCIPTHVANFAAYYRALDKVMKLSGARVLLSGLGGDELQLGDGEPFSELIDLLCQGRFCSLHRRLGAWTNSQESYFQFAWQNVFSSLLPRRLQLSRQNVISKLVEFYNPDFVRRMDLRDRLFGPQHYFRCAPPGFRYRANYFLYTTRQLSAGFWQELCDVEFSYPFTHKPLVEFMLAIPSEQHARPHESKSLVRRALRDLLPAELIERKETRITIWHAASLAVKREAQRIQKLIMEADEIVDLYIDRKAVLSACSKNQPDVLLLPLVPFVLWLQTFAKRKRVSESKSSLTKSRAA